MKKPDLSLLNSLICILILSISGSEAHTQKTTITSKLNGQAIDPFIGKFKLDFNGTAVILEIIKDTDADYLIYANGQGPDRTTKTGNTLSGISEGVQFAIKQVGNELIFQVNNQDYSLERVSVELTTTKENNIQKSDSDPFVGRYDVSIQGQIKEKWTIQKLNETTYTIISPSGTSQATRTGNVLNGYDAINQISFMIEKRGSLLLMNIAGIQIELINKVDITGLELNGQSGLTDPRLIGTWSGSSSYTSTGGVGTASMAFLQTYVFNEDGTFQSKSEKAGGGGDWSAQSSGEVETGQYFILNKLEEGGHISINGKQMKYVFYDEGYKMKMGNMHYSRH